MVLTLAVRIHISPQYRMHSGQMAMTLIPEIFEDILIDAQTDGLFRNWHFDLRAVPEPVRHIDCSRI